MGLVVDRVSWICLLAMFVVLEDCCCRIVVLCCVWYLVLDDLSDMLRLTCCALLLRWLCFVLVVKVLCSQQE